MPPRVHITGPSGSGTTTLGRAVATRLGVPLIDTDDVYWAETAVPFTLKRAVPERISLIRARAGDGGWVLSGSADGWGDPVLDDATLLVLLTLDTDIRLERLRRRERAEFGDRIADGGDMHRVHADFLAWAARYDDPYFEGRSRARHDALFARWSGAKVELSGALPVQDLVMHVMEAVPN